MSVTTLTSREFNQDTSRAKKAAAQGPVFITDRGRPAHVLLSIEAYRQLTNTALTLYDAFSASPDVVGGDLEIPPRTEQARFADLDG